MLLDATEVLDGRTVERRVSVDAFQVVLSRFIAPGVKQRIYGELVSLLAERGDLDTAMVDAAEMLSLFMHDGMPDAVRFREATIPVIEQACRRRNDCVIRAYGEMVDVLWQASQTVEAIRLEMLWNLLAQTHSFSLLCGYSMGRFYNDVGQHEVLRQHTYLVSDPETPPRYTDDPALPSRAIGDGSSH